MLLSQHKIYIPYIKDKPAVLSFKGKPSDSVKKLLYVYNPLENCSLLVFLILLHCIWLKNNVVHRTKLQSFQFILSKLVTLMIM